MKYNFRVNAIADQFQSISDKHAIFQAGVADLPAPWGIPSAVPAPDPGAQLCAILSASKLFGKGVRGEIIYQFRRKFSNDASEDDTIFLSFNPTRLDFKLLIYKAFMKFVKSFDAYYAEIADDEFIFLDFNPKRELGIFLREGIYRVAPICYWRSDLCQRAFGLSPAQIVARLDGKVEHVEEAAGGVFIVLASTILPTAELDALCWKAKEHL